MRQKGCDYSSAGAHLVTDGAEQRTWCFGHTTAGATVIILAGLCLMLMVGCTVEPQVVVVEITRLVPEVQEVEVTRLVEKEVTRVVQVPAPGAAAQTGVIDLQHAWLDLWPDYDEPSVLIMLTGELPPDTPLPAAVTIPLPSSAAINAVAEASSSGLASIPYETGPGEVRFLTTTSRFRVEYYDPYQTDGDKRAYRFDWPAPFTIGELGVRLQVPAAASNFESDPAPVQTLVEPSDGLTYFDLPSTASPAGTPLSLSLSYRNESDELTADRPGDTPPALPDNPFHEGALPDNA
ncbi:MAG: hypothetical protein ACK2UK_21885 [Candidatus Promineifilaceae bacterium]